MRADDVFAVVERHLLSQTEPELLLLKGHLILEQCLNELLLSYFTEATSIERLNLSFSKKLDLLVALGHSLYVLGENGEALIREVNAIRNKLAHRLNYEGLQDELGAWACRVQGFTPKTIARRATYLNTVRRAFAHTAAYMTGVAETKRDLRAQSVA